MDLYFFSFYALEELSPMDKGSHENKIAACCSGLSVGFGVGYISTGMFTLSLTGSRIRFLSSLAFLICKMGISIVLNSGLLWVYKALNEVPSMWKALSKCLLFLLLVLLLFSTLLLSTIQILLYCLRLCTGSISNT